MSSMKTFLQKYSILGVFLLLFVIFALFVNSFLTEDNLFNIIVQSTLLAVLALGLNLVMMAGEIDISFSGSVPLLASVFVILIKNGSGMGVALLAIFTIGMLIGLINVLFISKLKLNSFITTVAMMFLLTGFWYAFTGGNTVWVGPEFNRDLFYGYIGPVPIVGIILLVLFGLLYFLSEQTRFGMALRAVRSDAEAARSSGINVFATKAGAFVIAGAVFALSALLSVARLSGALATAGADVMLPTMTIAFVGQSVLGMGRPNMWGILIGALLLGMVNNAFILMRLPFWSVPMAYGIILLVSIALANIGQNQIKQIRM
jgi:ribose/xylose/arabinose/galactoside ABC-type transport system permease subunit